VNEREVARELLRELVQGALAGANGHEAPDPSSPPQVPAPPVAAVLRPSTWSEPAGRGEVIGRGAGAPATDPATELVVIDSDADLERFVRALADRLEDPGARAAIRAGHVRFALRRRGGGSATGTAPGVVRIERGAVTERMVEKAAKAGTRLVLAPGAVPTPLAREKARALGIEIERE
jgi:hypothetical protein